ncbi:hypothetical protein H6G20_14250 [Desertifilum sp. FACHB-1129]|uniref:NYN domain-containing protein n=1 Tax=Desertifilum tharense IPPAS B-1220 TaxID=1781255 RepID=A0A1E5QPJ0_9CYAN|nr:hypothetical protein [Desertifilum sp. FACHB-1129]MBD2324194.1 hypothetical protein [Desertifilum sp. FACHB-866]MBD2334208.1 hypothetical protein [Desertifilum sp. FACHB-868]OEJ76273.1 hypothetical protein BH720_05400 [Desertifilum tharense IPPAS B-1220]
MQCPRCQSTETRKNGRVSGKQRYYCKSCQRSFLQAELLPVSASIQNSLPLEPDIQANVLPLIEYLLKLQPSEGIETTVRQVLQALHYLKSLDTHSCSNHSSPPEPQGLSLLLLDAENIKFDPHLETFLAQLSSYPLNVKIAFANWKNTAGDSELYERGYQMIHVPLGKNSADAQMLAMGSAIRLHYPQVKEAFICSSDWLLNHLCNELQNQGLTVYRVRREDDNFRIENRQTGEIRYYSTTYNVEVPTPLDLMQSIEQLIQAEHQSLTERLVQLSTVMNLVQQRAAIEKQEKARISPSLDGLSSADKPIESQPLPEPPPENIVHPEIKTRAELEKALIKIVANLTAESPGQYISISKLSSEFHQQYGKTYKEMSGTLGIKNKFLNFLQACSALIIKKQGTVYEVAIRLNEVAQNFD